MSPIFQLGEEVWVCYDGKIGRKVPGIITSISEKSIIVAFIPSEYDLIDENVLIEGAFPFPDLGAYVDVKCSLMRNLFGCPGDWYEIYTKEE